MDKKRPVNLQLTTIKFPIPAIISILHRISGLIVFLAIPFLLWMLYHSLATRAGFYNIQQFVHQPLIKITFWVILSGMFYHLIAGIRHLLMDAGIGETLAGARCSAKFVLVLSIISAILVGVWLW